MNSKNSRRDFLSGLCAGGALLATRLLPGATPSAKASAAPRPTALPKNDAERLALFRTRGIYEQLTITYRHIHIGLEKPFSVLHVSDTHLTAAYPHEQIYKDGTALSRTKCFGALQEEALATTLNWAKNHTDYLLHTGDLIDWQSEANFDLVKKYFGAYAPFAACPGNHEFYTYLKDERHTWKEPFKERSWPIFKRYMPYDARFSAHVINGVNFILLDDVFGTVMPDQVERFKAEAHKGLPMILCMHVPIHTNHIWRVTQKYWNDAKHHFTSAVIPPPTGDALRQREDPVTRDFINYLRQEPLLKGLLTGHQHINIEERFSPTAMQYVVGANYLFHAAEIMFT